MAENQPHFPQRPPPLNLSEIFGVDQVNNWHQIICGETPAAPSTPRDSATPPSQIEECPITPEPHQNTHSIP